MRADSTVGIEFQGLAGAPAVSLSGGTLAAPLLAEAGADKRRLAAEKNAGQSMTQAARDVLRKLDVLVADNTAAFTSAVANVDKFAAALARNSEKVDGIVAGIERMTGGGPKITPRIYELAAATQFPPIAAFPKGQMQLPDPTSLSLIENERIVVSGGEKPSIENAQWPDLLPRVVQSALLRSFENAGYRRIFSRAPDGARTDYQLLIDIRRFHCGAAAACRFRPRGGAHGGDHGVVGRRFDGDDRVAGVDRALEGMRAFDRHHVGDLGHAEQGGDAGHQVLAEGGAGAEHVGIALGQRRDLRRQHLRDGVGIGGIGDGQHVRHAGDLRGLGGDAGRIGGEHDDVDGIRLQRLRGAHALGGGRVELAVQVFGDDQNLAHHSNPFCFSVATSSAASFTITPRLRLAGAA